MKTFFLFLCVIFFLSCKNQAGRFEDPPAPPPDMTPEEIAAKMDELSRQEREYEQAQRLPEDYDPVVPRVKEPSVPELREPQVRSFVRPLSSEEEKRVHKQLSECGEKALTVEVMVSPDGVVFLAPDQRFLESDILCFDGILDKMKLDPGPPRKGTIHLP